jgi:opacity protein-like surface antigen
LVVAPFKGPLSLERRTQNMKQVRSFAIAGIILCCLSTPCLSADVTGRAGIGTALGSFTFISDEYMNGNALDSKVYPRLYGQMWFGYAFKPYLAATASAGFGWTAYSFDHNRLVTVVPVNFGAEYRLGTGKYVPRAGAGFGVYHWSVLEDRRVLKDAVTREVLRRNDIGIYGLVGLDYFATPNIAVSVDVEGHRIFSKDTEDFPSGYGYNDDMAMVKVGVKYFFSTQRKGR